jgi:uncharacterized SAM-binding protein YcdF (DUF218 family)
MAPGGRARPGPWLSPLVGAATVLSFFVVAFTPLANFAHARFVTAPRVEPARAIVVLGAGADDDYLTERSLRRTVHGLRLFHRGLAPLIVLHGPRDGAGAITEAAARAELARDLGVPEGAILLAGGRTTQEEAQQSWARLAPQGATRILLVTGSHHMWRARALFERQGFEVLPAPVDEVAPHGSRPEQRLGTARSLLQEGMARVVYRLAGRV